MIWVSLQLSGVVLVAGPGHEVSAGSERWVPPWLEQAVVLPLQFQSHFKLVIEVGHIEVVSAVLHQSLPHFGVVLIVALNNKPSWLHSGGLLLLVSYLLGEGLSFVCFFLLQLSFDLREELLFKENVLILLLIHFLHLFFVHIGIWESFIQHTQSLRRVFLHF